MKIVTNSFFIEKIYEKNLKGFDINIDYGDIVFIGGPSGSGKSTLVLDVIYRESNRQNLIRNATNELYQYAIRPNFKNSSVIIDSDVVTQRGLFSSITSTFGTKTNLINEIRNVFVKYGVIRNNGRIINKNSFAEVINFRNQLFSGGRVYYILNFKNYNEKKVYSIFNKTSTVYVKNFKTDKIVETKLSNLKNYNSDNYFFLIEAKDEINDYPLLLIDNDMEINFDEKYFDIKNNQLFTKPHLSLFTKSQNTTNSGLCVSCQGTGNICNYKKDIIDINKKIIDFNINLNVNIKTGRYDLLKFTQTGFIKLLSTNNVDINQSYKSLSFNEKKIFDTIILDKLMSHNIDSLLIKTSCNDCNGSGYKTDVSHIFIGDFTFPELEQLTLDEILFRLKNLINKHDIKSLSDKNEILHKLKLHSISLNRSSLDLSSGEIQRIKLFDLLKNKISEKLIIIDEPSVNLHYNDNYPILDLLSHLSKNDNTLIIIDHNEIYKKIANKVIYLGFGSGVNGGAIISKNSDTATFKYNRKIRELEKKTFDLMHLNTVQIDQLTIPNEGITCCIGSSGSGKTTLLTKILPLTFEKSDIKYAIFDSKTISTNIQSILATYIDMFDTIRNLFSKRTGINASHFSFNSQGGCPICNGHGVIDNNLCQYCHGTRYIDDIRLIKVDGYTIDDILNMNLSSLIKIESFKFLSKAYYYIEALGLDHLTLGRSIPSLSGGEAQRLKLVKFLLSTKKVDYIILDEPCRGLDKVSISKMLKLFDETLFNKSILIIEHNIQFIQQCDFIIDLGISGINKNISNIVVGPTNLHNFPSLQISDNDFQYDHSYKKLNIGVQSTENNTHLSKTLLEQQNFELENKFEINSNFISDNNIVFYKKYDDLMNIDDKKSTFYFNPLIDSLYQFPYINLKKNNVKTLSDAWNYLVAAQSLEEAYVRGKGVVATKNSVLTYHTTRALSIKDQHIGPLIDYKDNFNIYLNSCRICKGYGMIKSYPFEKMINSNYSIFDEKFLGCNLFKILPKKLIEFLMKEFKFPFDLPFNQINLETQNIILYGAKHINFIPSLKDEKGIWRGINSYLYFYGAKVSSEFQKSKIENLMCPCCKKGFNFSSQYFTVNNEKIFDFY